jgi:glycosyltransferase involved in cell wall biosynthesis
VAHRQQIEFLLSVKAEFPEFFDNVFVLDLGSLDINGNNQHLFDTILYLGVDVALGRNVDIAAKAHEVNLPDASFDVVISTEALEHDQFYRETLLNACRLLKPGGLLLLTCATEGRAEHGTRRTTPQDAPLLAGQGGWHDYYRNLGEAEIRAAIPVDTVFSAYRFAVNDESHDLYFWGRKPGVLAKRVDASFQISPVPGRRAGTKMPAEGMPPCSQPRGGQHRDIAEILTPYDSTEAVQRMKIEALVRFKGGEFDFRPFGAGGDDTRLVLINSRNIDHVAPPAFWSLLQERARRALVMAVITDVDPVTIATMQKLSAVVDVFLVPTPEMRDFLRGFTRSQVLQLFDPIDFGFGASFSKPANDERLKVVWFGYPESYRRSIAAYAPCLGDLHQRGMIEFNIVTNSDRYGVTPSGIIHEYVPAQFPTLLTRFDVCVLSHAPVDLSVGTLWKSENKAVLAINRGLPVVASRTPAYERLLEACGLGDYLFSTSDELAAALRRLASWSERHRYLALSQDYVLENYSAMRMAERWHEIFIAARASKAARSAVFRADAKDIPSVR